MNSLWFWVLGIIAYLILTFALTYLFGTWIHWGQGDDDD